MPAKRYFTIFVATLLMMAGLVVLFDRLVDPFWFYRDVSIDGFNAIKPKFKNYERHVKPSIVQREQPASLIFGSSFSEVGFDPLHPALRALGASYNFGIAGASWDMVECNVQFALVHDAALRQIVLGIHPLAMPAKDCGSEIAGMVHPDERAFLFSSDAFEASVNTVVEQHKNNPSHTADGLYFYTRGLPGTINRFRDFFALNAPCEIDNVARSGAVDRTQEELMDLAGLRDIVRKATTRGIVLKLVVYPRHALSFEREYQCGTRQSRWNALEQIVRMVEQESGGMVEVWDFEGYHEIGTESISQAADKYWQDPAHFNYEFGDIMLDEMFALKRPNFGIRLTTVNSHAHADRERISRLAYIDAHPEFLQQLDNLLPHHAK